jgi:parvulin-like peptidyl-prolyl isomerase
VEIAEIYTTVLDQLIAARLMDQRAQELRMYPSHEEVQARLDEMRAEIGSPADFRLMLTVQNMSEEDLKQQLSEQISVENMLNQEVFAKIEIPDEEVQAYYDAHADEMTQSETANVRHIFVRLRSDMTEAERAAARSKIDAVKERLDAGEAFGQLAVELSEDSSAARGGELGWLQRDRLTGPFQLVAFSTPVGEVSDVVAADYGYHIIEVKDRKPASKIPLEQVRATITGTLRDQRMGEAIKAFIAGLREGAQVETYVPVGEETR